MKFKSFMVILGVVCLVAVIVLSWGCQNQPTGPETKMEGGTPPRSIKTRSYSSGSCGSYWYTNWIGAGSVNFNCNGSNGFSASFSGANFVTGIGWSTGSSRTISFSGSCSGCNWGPGIYGWLQNPLVEYYIGNNGGSGSCGYSCNGRSYTLRTATRTNAPSIEGTRTFTQYLVGGSRSGPVDMGCHYNAWRNCGRSVGSQNYQVVMVEGWSHNSGSASVTLSGGSTTSTTTSTTSTTTTTSGGSTTTTTSGGGGSVFECENYTSKSSSGYIGTSGSNYSGSGYFNEESGSWFQWNNVNISGNVTLRFRYAAAASGRTSTISVNGSNVGTLFNGNTGGWDSYSTEDVSASLNSGSNTIRVTRSGGNARIDRMEVIGGGGTTTTTSGGTTTTTSASTTTTTSSWWWGGWW